MKETMKKVHDIMHETHSTLLNECKGPNNSMLEFWQVGSSVCIIQYFEDRGCTHFVQGNGITWLEMQQQFEDIIQGADNDRTKHPYVRTSR